MKENKKGITLIALIITIIVMLILVAVTVIAVTDADGGIFGKAETASRDTEKETIYDQIVGAMQLDDDGRFNAGATYNKARKTLEDQGMEVGEKGTDGTFTVTGKRGTYTYKITGSGIEKDPKVVPDSEGVSDSKAGIYGGIIDPTDDGDIRIILNEDNTGTLENLGTTYNVTYTDTTLDTGDFLGIVPIRITKATDGSDNKVLEVLIREALGEGYYDFALTTNGTRGFDTLAGKTFQEDSDGSFLTLHSNDHIVVNNTLYVDFDLNTSWNAYTINSERTEIIKQDGNRRSILVE